ncbi:MAG: hypothetical protein GX557_02455 [Chloroflexi bacterium]|nr:hypothetical protein [Chloroflexota bacterium]
MRPASTTWLNESNQVGDEEVAFQKRFTDRDTGVEMVRLTSQPCVNEHIYPEAPISTPDGRRLIFSRRASLSDRRAYWIADLETHRIRQITDEPDASWPVVAPDGRWFYYAVGDLIRRMDAETFEREDVARVAGDLAWVSAHSSVDYSGTRFAAAARSTGGVPSVAVIDLDGRARVVFEHADALNAHAQYSNNALRRVLVQVNDGIERDANGNVTRLVGDNGASLHVVNDDGSGHVRLNVGSTPFERVQGHECWVGSQDLIITTLHRRDRIDQPWIQDRVVVIGVGDETYRIVGQGEGFTHIHATRDGRFWVSDCNRTADIFVGSVQTGRYRLFCHSGATFGAPQYTHPHPFFTADGRTIGWNSDVTGVPHVYCARIPEGFLEALL